MLSVMCGGLIVLPSVYSVNNMPIVSVAHAEVKTYVGTGKYIMSDFENQNIAQQRAIDRALRDAQRQSGEYLQTYSRSINGKLTNDEISTITNNIVEVLEANCIPQPFEQNGESGLMYKATVKVKIDTNGVRAWLKRDEQDRATLVNQNKAEQQADDTNDLQVEDLRKRAQNATTDAERERIRAEYQQADNEFLANQKYKEGNRLAFQGNYSNAIPLYNEAIKLNPQYEEAYINRGNCYRYLKNYDAAIADYSKAINLNPNEAAYYSNRGNSYYKIQKYTQAMADFNKAIELNPKFWRTYYNRGLLYYDLEKYKEAIADYTKLIKIKSNYVLAYDNRGVAYYKMNDYNAAAADFTKAISLNPTEPLYYYHRGLSYDKMENYSAAIADFTKAIELKPQDEDEYYFRRGVAYALFDNLVQAIKDFDKAIELSPNNGRYYKLRGLCYQQMGDNVNAQADFDKARQLGYND